MYEEDIVVYLCLKCPMVLSVSFRVVSLMFDRSSLFLREKHRCNIGLFRTVWDKVLLNRVKYLFDRRTLITIINSLVFSKLLYCSSVWANTTNKNIELLQTVQNFAARIVSGTRKFDHVTPILKQ